MIIIVIAIAIAIVFVSHSRTLVQRAEDDGAQQHIHIFLSFFCFHSICRMSAVVIVVTTQNNVNRIYFSWKYRLKSLYTGNLLSEAKWAFLCRFHGQPSVEKFDSQIVFGSVWMCWAGAGAGWCAFTIQWIGLIKKSFHCEWSENTQFWLLSCHCLGTHTQKSTLPLSKKLQPEKTK